MLYLYKERKIDIVFLIYFLFIISIKLMMIYVEFFFVFCSEDGINLMFIIKEKKEELDVLLFRV